MNILLISSMYPEPTEYKIKDDSLAVHYFARQWVNMGHRVVVLHASFNGIGNIKHFLRPSSFKIKHNINEGVDVVCGELQLFVPHALRPLKWRTHFLAIRMRMFLKKNLPSFVPDVLSVHFPVVLDGFTAQFGGLPQLAVFHGTDIRILESLKGESRQSLIRELNGRYARLAYRSPKLCETSKALGLDYAKSDILTSGISCSLVANQDVLERRANSHNNHPLRVIFAGKLVAQKRIDVVIRALALLKDLVDFRFDIVGDGPANEFLKQVTEESGLSGRVFFNGRKPREEVSHFMAEADVFIMVSTNETLGLVYLEAMAQGCITIGSKGEGIDGIIVNGQNGFLVDPYNIDEISCTVKKIYNMPIDERMTIIKNAYNDMTAMTDVTMSNKYLRILNNIAND